MKISNSKKQLTKIISENGGWQGGNFCAQQGDGEIWFSKGQPGWNKGRGTFTMDYENHITIGHLIANRHQTILSRDEYFHLYPAPDADGWIEWHGGECPVDGDAVVEIQFKDGDFGSVPEKGGRLDWGHFGNGGDIVAYRLHKPEFCESVTRTIPDPDVPTIEQLAADYRAKLAIAQQAQEEADSHRCGAEAALDKLVAAGKALGLVVGVAVQEPELVITDSAYLLEGDVIELTAGKRYNKTECTMVRIAGVGLRAKSASDTVNKWWDLDGPVKSKWRFIRRP